MTRLGSISAAILLMAATSSLGACTSLVYGSDPNVAALDHFTIGVTSESEIRTAVGPPRGGGAAMFAGTDGKRDIMFYEFMRTDGVSAELKILIVLLKDGRYDGHYWFASTEIMDQAGL